MSSFAETSSEGDGLPSKRALGAFPSFASQGEDQISSTSFQDTLGLYGMAVLKFGRFGNPKRRLLMWSKDDPTNLFWCQDFTELSSVMRVREIPPDARSVNLLDVHEIRRGTEEDPTHPGYCGTTILRKHCHPSKFCYAISLITDTRTIDLEFLSKEDFKKFVPNLLRVFKALKSGRSTLPEFDPDLSFSDVYR